MTFCRRASPEDGRCDQKSDLVGTNDGLRRIVVERIGRSGVFQSANIQQVVFDGLYCLSWVLSLNPCQTSDMHRHPKLGFFLGALRHNNNPQDESR